jgi:hypothetical protein
VAVYRIRKLVSVRSLYVTLEGDKPKILQMRSPTFLARLRLRSSAAANMQPVKITFTTAHCPVPQTKVFFSAGTFRQYFRGWMFNKILLMIILTPIVGGAGDGASINLA